MSQRTKISEIIRNNPQVDATELQKGIRLLEELRRSGVSAPAHRLPPPFARKRARIIDNDSENDPRTIRLRRS